MRATLDSILNQIQQFFSGLSAREKRRFFVLGVAIVVLSVAAAWLLGRTTYAVVWTGLDPATAGARTAAIKELGVKYKLEDGGTTILVPADQVGEVRNSLAASGVTDSSLNLDIYSLASGLGMTSEDRKAYLQWQIAEQLRTVYRDMSVIEDAKVIISIGAQTSFITSQASPTTASIMVTVKGDAALSQNEASAIINFATAVDGLFAENITLTDRVGRIYSISGVGMVEIEEEIDAELDIIQKLALQAQMKADLERQIYNLFIPVTGAGNLAAMVDVTLDFDKQTIEKIEFAPPVDGQLDGIAVSLYELWQIGADEEYTGGVPGTDTNGMGTVEYPYLELGEDEYFRQFVRQVNYEINETRTLIEKSQGTVSRLSVGIIMNSNSVSADLADEMADVAAKALGIDVKSVSVQVAPFAALPEPEPAGTFDNPRLWELIMLGVKALVVLLLGLAVIAFLRALFAPRREPEPQLVIAGGPQSGAGFSYIAGDESDEALAALAYSSPEDEIAERIRAESEVLSENMPTLAEIEAAKKPDSIIQLENFIDRDPLAVAQMLRNWLSDE